MSIPVTAPETANDPESLMPSEVVTAWAKSLHYWDDDRIESEFADPSSGERFTFVITRRPEGPAAAERERTRIRARGLAYRRLAEAHGDEYEALLTDVLAELGHAGGAAR